MRRYVMAMVLVLAAVCGARAQQPVSVAEGSSVTVDSAFAVSQYDVADRTVLSVSLLGQRQVLLQGLKAGTTTVTLSGASGESRVIEARVSKNVTDLIRNITVALDDIPEVEVVQAGDKVLVRGVLASMANRNQVKKIVAAFGDQVLDLTTLEMPPELLVNLREGLRKANFKVADEAGSADSNKPGTLTVNGSGNMVYVSGAVYSPDDAARVNEIVAGQRWLVVKTEKEDPGAIDKYVASINVSVVPLMLEVDVAFISVSEEENKKIGVNLLDAGLMTIDLGGAIIGDAAGRASSGSGWTKTDGVRTQDPKVSTRERSGNQGESLTYKVATDLSGTLRFFTQENPSRVIHRGQLHFRNGSPEWRQLHSGGTLKVRLTSERDAKMEDIDYGFILKAKGGLKNADTASLEVEFELSTPSQMPGSEDYDIRRDRVNTSVDCPVGNTMVLGGANSLLDSVDVKGTPFLKNIPLLRNLFSEKTSGRTDSKMLILVSPHIASDMGSAAPVSAGNAAIIEMSEKPAAERMQDRR